MQKLVNARPTARARRIAAGALVAGLLAAPGACATDGVAGPLGGGPPDAFPADRRLAPASVEWSATARDLVAAQRSNAFVAVRNLATLNLAQHGAVLAAEDGSRGGRRLSRRAAVAAASAVALAYLYPSEAAALDARVQQQVATPGWLEAGTGDVAAALAAGRAAGEAVVARARTDRFLDPWTGTVPTGPGVWFSSQVPPAPPGGAALGLARPFFLATADQFRPGAPPAFGSPAFQAALAEVRAIADTRTAVQDSVAKFWALPTGTYTVAGEWNRRAGALATARGFGERRAAHLLALASTATYDALVACNDTKYVHWLLRPSQADPAIVLDIALPNFPSYPSNTACISAAEAEVVGALVPGERTRLHALAAEAALSRVYAGIHFRFDGDAGLELGRRVARHALAAAAHDHRPIPLR